MRFVHRAYAGMVGLVYLGCAVYALQQRWVPKLAKFAGLFGILALFGQIFLGRQTVLLQIRPLIVTSHLMLATVFFCTALVMEFAVDFKMRAKKSAHTQTIPAEFQWMTAIFTVLVFFQIVIGGFVASTYAGSVCVDWPMCNGQWVPTWSGRDRSANYPSLHCVWTCVRILLLRTDRANVNLGNLRLWVTPALLNLARATAATTLLQVIVGIANLLFLHSTIADCLASVDCHCAAGDQSANNINSLYVETIYSAGGVSGCASGAACLKTSRGLQFSRILDSVG